MHQITVSKQCGRNLPCRILHWLQVQLCAGPAVQPWKALYNTTIQSPDVQGEGQASIVHCNGDLQIPGFWAIVHPQKLTHVSLRQNCLLFMQVKNIDISTSVHHFLNGIRKSRRFRNGSGEEAGASFHASLGPSPPSPHLSSPQN